MFDLLGVVGALVVAALVLHLSGAVRGNLALVAALPAVALGSLSIASFGVLAIGLELGFVTLTLAFAAVVAYWGTLAWRFRATTASVETPVGGCWGVSATPPPGVIPALAGSALFLLWAGSQWIAAWPHGSADAVNIWTSRALFLARVAGDIPERFALMPQGHPDYPLLVPTAVAAQFAGTGSESLVIPQATSALWLVGAVAATFALTTRLSNAMVGAIAAVAVATNPLLVRWGFAQGADVALAYLLLLVSGGLAIVLAQDGDEPFSPPLLGFFAGLLMWTKTEGTVVGAVLVGLVAAYGLLRAQNRAVVVRRARYFALGMAPPVTALVLFRAVWIRGVQAPTFLPADWAERIGDIDRWRLLLSTAAYEASFDGRMRVSATVMLLVIAVVLIALAVRRGNAPPAARYLLLVPCLVAPIYLTAYLLSPYELGWHVSTSVDRLLLHLMPIVMVAAALILSAADERDASGPATITTRRHE